MELCIALPVRLSNLLPYLTLLLSPVITSLTCSENVVTQGMRTIELCADHLHQDYFQDHLHSVIGELMHGLWSNVRSVAAAGELAAANDTARTAARILGKLGGANRRPMLLYESQPLAYAPLSELAADAELLSFGVELPVTDSPTPLALNVDRVRSRSHSHLLSLSLFSRTYSRTCISRIAPSLTARRQRLHGAHASGHYGVRQQRAALPEPVTSCAAAAAPPLSQRHLVRCARASRCDQQLLARHIQRAASLLQHSQVTSHFFDALRYCKILVHFIP